MSRETVGEQEVLTSGLNRAGFFLILVLGASASALIFFSCVRAAPAAPAIIPGEVEGGVSGGTNTDLLYRFPPRFAPPQLVDRIEPIPSEEALRAGVQGTLTASLYVDVQGIVRSVRVEKGLPFGLVDAAVMAFAEWRFAPARENGRPVPSVYLATVEFRLSPDR